MNMESILLRKVSLFRLDVQERPPQTRALPFLVPVPGVHRAARPRSRLLRRVREEGARPGGVPQISLANALRVVLATPHSPTLRPFSLEKRRIFIPGGSCETPRSARDPWELDGGEGKDASKHVKMADL